MTRQGIDGVQILIDLFNKYNRNPIENKEGKKRRVKGYMMPTYNRILEKNYFVDPERDEKGEVRNLLKD